MAAVNQVDLQQYNGDDELRAVIGLGFWGWYEIHQDDKVVKLKFLFFNVTVRVHHLEGLFEILFGPRP